MCGTNISLPDNTVDVSDHIEITCSVTFNGMYTPVFVCAPDSPGTNTTTTTITSQTSSSHVLHHRVIAASHVDDFAVLTCSMSFTLTTDYRTVFPEALREPEKPVYDFIWKTPPIRIVDASGEYHYMYVIQIVFRYMRRYIMSRSDLSLSMTDRNAGVYVHFKQSDNILYSGSLVSSAVDQDLNLHT